MWLFALCAVVFAVITWQVVTDGPLRAADERVDKAIVLRGPLGLMEVLTDLGSMPVALPVLALVLGYVLWRGERLRALAGAVAMALVPVLVVPLKEWTDRQGPLTDATGYYPSGHTATAMTAYGTAALLLAPYVGRRVVAPLAAALTVATAVGLVQHGYHWPLDVIASGALCGMLLLALAAVLRRVGLRGRPPGRGRRPAEPVELRSGAGT